MCNFLLTLFFAIVLLIASLFFPSQLFTFAFVAFLQVLAGATSSFLVAFCGCCLFFSAYMQIYLHCFMKIYSHCIGITFLLLFLTRFVLAFFVVQNSCLYQFLLARFRVFGVRCVCFFALLLLIYIHIILRASCFPSIPPHDPL